MGGGTNGNLDDDDRPCQQLASRHDDTYNSEVAAELINASHILQFTFQQKDKAYPYVIHLPGRMAAPLCKSKPTDPTIPVLYAKGWLPCEFVDQLKDHKGIPVTVSTAKAESIYCARSTFGHGLTWRSTVINGTAYALTFEKEGASGDYKITEQDIKGNEKLWGLHQIVNGYIPDEWENTRSPMKKEVDLTLVLRVDIDTDQSHVHVRHGFNRWEIDWETSKPDEYWEGTIPVWETYGDPFYGDTKQEFPLRLKRFFEQKTRKNKGYAMAQAGKDSFP